MPVQRRYGINTVFFCDRTDFFDWLQGTDLIVAAMTEIRMVSGVMAFCS